MPSHAWKDEDGLASGTQEGATGTSIVVKGQNFNSCGVVAGLAVKNVTTAATGIVQSGVTDTTIPTNVTFNTDDEFIIYCTGTVDKTLSYYGTDRIYGDFVETEGGLDRDGFIPKERDIDWDDKGNVFGPGQPSRSHK